MKGISAAEEPPRDSDQSAEVGEKWWPEPAVTIGGDGPRSPKTHRRPRPCKSGLDGPPAMPRRGAEQHPEAVALLAAWVVERARQGSTVTGLTTAGRSVLAREQVMEEVAELITEVQWRPPPRTAETWWCRGSTRLTTPAALPLPAA